LDGAQVTVALANATDPYRPSPPGAQAVPGIPITLRSPE
jgi:hypothetical protein